MKRGFFFGLGSFLVCAVLAGLMVAAQQRYGKMDLLVGAVMVTTCVPLSLWTIRSAKSAPPNKSRWHTAFGWVAGFLAVDVAILSVMGLLYLM